ncbi:uncharacterized protein TNCV_2957801 [Trichonephila clavipes]|nr:uncharacterized protein TNCV_2957801 [Trichonephila clavipes]
MVRAGIDKGRPTDLHIIRNGNLMTEMYADDILRPHVVLYAAITCSPDLNLNDLVWDKVGRHVAARVRSPVSWRIGGSDFVKNETLEGYLKDIVLSAPIPHLAELKSRIAQHILNATPETLRSVVERAILQTTVDRILNMFRASLAKFKRRFDRRFLCDVWPQDN